MQHSRTRRRRIAWILILLVDLGFVAWGAMAAASPDHLLGPKGMSILAAGYEGFTKSSWSELATTAPMTARYIGLLFRMYGVLNVVFGLMVSAITVTAFRRGERWAWWALLVGNTIALVSAMTYDQIANAVGPFELTEYLGLTAVYGALAVTAPWRGAERRPLRRATLQISAHMKIRPDQLEGFKKQAAECIRITREKDTHTLRYDWFISSDGECEVREEYTGPEGLIEHNENIHEARAKLFEVYADDHFMTFYTEPIPSLLELAKAAHVEHQIKWFGFFAGLDS